MALMAEISYIYTGFRKGHAPDRSAGPKMTVVSRDRVQSESKCENDDVLPH
jgi:hypothetical protein